MRVEKLHTQRAWPEAYFQWVRETTRISPGVHVVSVTSDVPGTREMHEIWFSACPRAWWSWLAVPILASRGILAATRKIDPRLYCLSGGLHLVTTAEPEVCRVATALGGRWQLQSVAPGHYAGEPPFAALQDVFGERYHFAGVVEVIELPKWSSEP